MLRLVGFVFKVGLKVLLLWKICLNFMKVVLSWFLMWRENYVNDIYYCEIVLIVVGNFI